MVALATAKMNERIMLTSENASYIEINDTLEAISVSWAVFTLDLILICLIWTLVNEKSAVYNIINIYIFKSIYYRI